MNDMLSPADIAVLSGNGRNDNNGAFGDNGAWWIVIFLIFALGGWGNGFGGFGGNRGGSNSGVGSDYVLASDMATLQRNIESVNQGLCDGFYAMNTGMLNGFANVQSTLCTGFGGINNAITSQGYETRLGTQNLASQLASCCCDIRQELASCCCQTQRAIDGVNYNMAMNTNAIQQTLCNNTRDIIENQNNNYRALHDELVNFRIEDKNNQITALQNQLNNAELRASQEAQTNYLYTSITDKLSPCPRPAYLTCNPNAPFNYSVVPNNCCGCNSGCGNF